MTAADGGRDWREHNVFALPIGDESLWNMGSLSITAEDAGVTLDSLALRPPHPIVSSPHTGHCLCDFCVGALKGITL